MGFRGKSHRINCGLIIVSDMRRGWKKANDIDFNVESRNIDLKMSNRIDTAKNIPIIVRDRRSFRDG